MPTKPEQPKPQPPKSVEARAKALAKAIFELKPKPRTGKLHR